MWMVLRQDERGLIYLMKEGLTREAAKKYVSDICAKHSKPHGQYYHLYSYTSETRTSIINELHVIR